MWPKTPASHAGNMGSNPVRVTIYLQLHIMILDRETYLIYSAKRHNKKVGVDCDEVPPVPIPNTEVKLTCVEDTWLETAWENRSAPASLKQGLSQTLFDICINFLARE